MNMNNQQQQQQNYWWTSSTTTKPTATSYGNYGGASGSPNAAVIIIKPTVNGVSMDPGLALYMNSNPDFANLLRSSNLWNNITSSTGTLFVPHLTNMEYRHLSRLDQQKRQALILAHISPQNVTLPQYYNDYIPTYLTSPPYRVTVNLFIPTRPPGATYDLIQAFVTIPNPNFPSPVTATKQGASIIGTSSTKNWMIYTISRPLVGLR